VKPKHRLNFRDRCGRYIQRVARRLAFSTAC
jgi:hypothetical protein